LSVVTVPAGWMVTTAAAADPDNPSAKPTAPHATTAHAEVREIFDRIGAHPSVVAAHPWQPRGANVDAAARSRPSLKPSSHKDLTAATEARSKAAASRKWLPRREPRRVLGLVEREKHTATELRVLLELAQRRDATIFEVAEKLALRPAVLREAARRLAGRGLVQSRHIERSERTLLAITQSGREIAGALSAEADPAWAT
jgi:DNA-binding MarR family transcriptional regulator